MAYSENEGEYPHTNKGAKLKQKQLKFLINIFKKCYDWEFYKKICSVSWILNGIVKIL